MNKKSPTILKNQVIVSLYLLTDCLYFIIEYPISIYPVNPTTKNTTAAIDTLILSDKIVNNKGDNELPIA